MTYLLHGVETQRLIFGSIDTVTFEQWLPFFRIANNARMVALGHLDTPEAQCHRWFQRAQERIASGRGGLNALFDKETGQLVGQCGLLVQSPCGKDELEVGYSLLPAYWGKGYATEAARAARDVAFFQGYANELISIIHIENEPSKKVARANGMAVRETTVYREVYPVEIYHVDRAGWAER